MYCTKCGSKLSEEQKFCTGCGERVLNEFSLDDQVVASKVSNELNANKESVDNNQTANYQVKENYQQQNTYEVKNTYQEPVRYEQVSANNQANGPINSLGGIAQMRNAESKTSFIKNPVIIGIIAAIFLLSSVGVFALKSDVFKSAKDIYLDIEGENLMDSISSIKNNYKDNYNKKIKPLLENSYGTKIEYSGNVDLSSMYGIDSKMASNINNLLENSKFVLESKVNPKKNQSITDFGVSMNGNKLINASIIQDNTKIAAHVPTFYSKYVYLDMNDLDEFQEKFGIKSGSSDNKMPEKLVTNNDIVKAIKVNETKILKSIKNYGKVISDSITKEQVTIEKNVDYKVNDLEFKTRKITVKIDDKTFKDMILKLIETAENDEELYNVSIQNIINVLKVYEDAGYDVSTSTEDIMDNLVNPYKSYSYNSRSEINYEEELSRENFKKGLEQLKEGLSEAFEYVSFPDGIEMSIYVDGKTIVGRTIEAKAQGGSSSETAQIEINTSGVSEYKNRNIANLEMRISVDKDSEGIIKLGYDTTIDGNDETGKAFMYIDSKEYGDLENILKADIDINNTKDKKSNSNKYSYKYDITGESAFNAKGNLEVSEWEKDKERKYGNDIKFSINVSPSGSSSEKIGANINIKTENSLKIDFKLPEFNSSNSIDIAKADQTQLANIQSEVMSSVEKFMADNQELINMFGGYNSYSGYNDSSFNNYDSYDDYDFSDYSSFDSFDGFNEYSDY